MDSDTFYDAAFGKFHDDLQSAILGSQIIPRDVGKIVFGYAKIMPNVMGRIYDQSASRYTELEPATTCSGSICRVLSRITHAPKLVTVRTDEPGESPEFIFSTEEHKLYPLHVGVFVSYGSPRTYCMGIDLCYIISYYQNQTLFENVMKRQYEIMCRIMTQPIAKATLLALEEIFDRAVDFRYMREDILF